MKKPILIVFDYDGTITEFSKKRGWMVKKFVPMLKLILDSLNVFYVTVKNIKNQICPDFHISGAYKKAVLSILSGKPHKDTIKLLDKSKEMNIKTAILSNNHPEWGERILRHFGLKEKFNVVSFDSKKPDPERLLESITDIHFENKRGDIILMVGDMDVDMQVAINAKNLCPYTIIPVAMGKDSPAAHFLRNHFNNEATKNPSTHIIVDNIGALLELVKRMPS